MAGKIISTEDLPVDLGGIVIGPPIQIDKGDQPLPLELIGTYGLNHSQKEVRADALAVADDVVEWFSTDDSIVKQRRDSSGNIFTAVDKVVKPDIIFGVTLDGEELKNG